MKRNLYLKTTPTAESVKRYMQALHEAGSLTPKTERVNVYDSLGRVTASPVFAKCCSPLFNAAAMDGIAVIAAQTAKQVIMQRLKEIERDVAVEEFTEKKPSAAETRCRLPPRRYWGSNQSTL